MSKISKWILLLLFFTMTIDALTGCFPLPPASGTPVPVTPLRPTLSALQTAAARLLEKPSVPQTGSTESPSQATLTPLPVDQPSLTPTRDNTKTGAQPGLTPTCPADDSKMELTAPKTALKVGDTIVVNVALKNTGCVSLGMPQYRLAILNGEGKPIFSPDKPEPVTHYLAVAPGASDEVTFTLQAVHPGKATLSAMASFEVHLGYPGPAYWGASGSKQLVIQVGE